MPHAPEELVRAGVPCIVHGGSQPSPTPAQLLLFNIIIINDWEVGVKSKLFRFVVYSEFLQVVSCHTADSRTSQKFMGKRALLLKGIHKNIHLPSLAQDCQGCGGKISLCQVALTRACTKRCILSLICFPLPHDDAFCRGLSRHCFFHMHFPVL